MPTAKKETNTAKGTAKTAKSISATVNRSQNPAGLVSGRREIVVLYER